MARPKTISDEEAINLVNEYFAGPCEGIASKLKLPDIAEYIKQHGHPYYRVETLRRSPAVRRHIESLRSTADAQSRVRLVAYQSLDIEALLDNNKTRAKLIRALTDIDMYYKSLAGTAAEIMKKDSEKTKKIGELQNNIDVLTTQNTSLQEMVTALKKEMQALRAQNDALHTVVDKYVYPEMASLLLEESGYIKLDTTYVDPEKAKEDIIDPSTPVNSPTKPQSKIIEGMFKKFDD